MLTIHSNAIDMSRRSHSSSSCIEKVLQIRFFFFFCNPKCLGERDKLVQYMADEKAYTRLQLACDLTSIDKQPHFFLLLYVKT